MTFFPLGELTLKLIHFIIVFILIINFQSFYSLDEDQIIDFSTLKKERKIGIKGGFNAHFHPGLFHHGPFYSGHPHILRPYGNKKFGHKKFGKKKFGNKKFGHGFFNSAKKLECPKTFSDLGPKKRLSTSKEDCFR